LKLSVLVPTFNEAREIGECLAWIRREHDGEILVADGGSTDATAEIAENAGARVIRCPKGLAAQLNLASGFAGADVLGFIAADSRPEPGWKGAVTKAMGAPQLEACGFRLRIDDPHPALKLIEWGGNFRARYLAITLPDQGLFVRRRKFFDLGGFCEDSLIPYISLCEKLREEGQFRLLSHAMLSSSRKWREGGIVRTTARHLGIYLRFRALGA